MSLRDSFWFLAGALIALAVTALSRWWLHGRRMSRGALPIPSFAVPVAAGLALVGVALGIYLLLGTTNPDGRSTPRAVEADTRASVVPIVPAGDAQPTEETKHNDRAASAAGSLDEVTRRLADRLATRGGTDSEWQLLAQSYDYMGRTEDAKSARSHVVAATRSAGQATPGSMQAGVQQIAAVADSLESHQPKTASGTQR